VSRECRLPRVLTVPRLSTPSLICKNCDTVHRQISLAMSEVAHCSYCGAVLARKNDRTTAQLLAVTVAAGIVFVIANVTSILAIELVLLHLLRPWSMSEVFLLGSLVVIVKLSSWVHVEAGEGIWALGGLAILLAILSRYDSRDWWDLVEQARP